MSDEKDQFSVLVYGLGPDTTILEVYEVFKDFPVIQNICIKDDLKKTDERIAFISYDTAEECSAAKTGVIGRLISGGPIRVRVVKPTKVRLNWREQIKKEEIEKIKCDEMKEAIAIIDEHMDQQRAAAADLQRNISNEVEKFFTEKRESLIVEGQARQLQAISPIAPNTPDMMKTVHEMIRQMIKMNGLNDDDDKEDSDEFEDKFTDDEN